MQEQKRIMKKILFKILKVSQPLNNVLNETDLFANHLDLMVNIKTKKLNVFADVILFSETLLSINA
jgi:hypothetical protein